MIQKWQRGARVLVIGGFGVVVIGGIVNVINIYGSGMYKFFKFSGDLVQFLIPLATIATIAAWWFMGQMVVEQPEQQRLLRRAYWCFGVEYLIMFAASVALGWRSTALAWTDSVSWILGAGEGLTSVGFLLMARLLSAEVAPGEQMAVSGSSR